MFPGNTSIVTTGLWTDHCYSSLDWRPRWYFEKTAPGFQTVLTGVSHCCRLSWSTSHYDMTLITTVWRNTTLCHYTSLQWWCYFKDKRGISCRITDINIGFLLHQANTSPGPRPETPPTALSRLDSLGLASSPLWVILRGRGLDFHCLFKSNLWEQSLHHQGAWSECGEKSD